MVLEQHLPDGNSMTVFSPSPAARCVPNPHPLKPAYVWAGFYTAQGQKQNTENDSFLLPNNRSWFSKCRPRTSNTSITWKLARNAVSAPSPDLLSQIVPFDTTPRWFVCTMNLRSAVLRHTLRSSHWFCDGACLEAPSSQISEERRDF